MLSSSSQTEGSHKISSATCSMPFDIGGAMGSKGEDGAAAGFDFHEVAEHFLLGALIAAHAYDSEVGVDEGDGAVFHFSGGIAVGIDVGDLFEF